MKKLLLFFGLLFPLSAIFSQAPANDICAGSQPITVAVGTANIYIVNMQDTTETLEGSCQSPSDIDPDLWFNFNMPVDGNVQISNITNNDYITVYESCGGAEVACFFNDKFIYALIGGENYILKYARFGTPGGTYDFTIEAFAAATNDICAMSQNITVATATANTYITNVSGATETQEGSCQSAGDIDADVWYNFDMPVDGNVQISDITNNDYITIYNSCGGAEVACFFNNNFIYSLSGGQNYTLKFARFGTPAAVNDFTIQAFSGAPNDVCAMSQNISVVTEMPNTYTANIFGATETAEGSCQEASDVDPDLWFNFTMPVNGNIEVTNISNNDYITLYEDCGGTEVACFFNDGVITNLLSGENYTLKFARFNAQGGTYTFDIQAFFAIANDDCENREVLAVTTANPLTVTPIDFIAATEDDPAFTTNCESNASTVYFDVWYEFTMPVNGNIVITDAQNVENFTLYDGCGGTEISCDTDDSILNNLTFGTTYVLRYSERELFANLSDFTIQAFEVVANDNCEDREIIAVTTTEANTYAVDFRGASEDDPAFTTGCEATASLEYFDVWYEFTMPVNGNIVITDAQNIENFTLYDGCGGTEISCDTDDSILNNLTAGTTYVLRYSERELFAGASDFSIQAFETVGNDDCLDRETIAVTTTEANTYAVDFRGASEDDPAFTNDCQTLASIEYFDVWYEFIMPVNGNIAITNAQNVETFSLFDGCGGTEIACETDNTIFNNLTAGTTYVLRYSEREFFAGASDFSIQAFETVGNDDCVDREIIAVTTTEANTYAVDFRGASEDDPAFTNDCQTLASIEYFDVWYEFIMPVNGNIAITNAQNVETFSLFDGCGGTEIACDTNSTIFNNLIAGTTYVLRYSERELFAGASDFSIQAFEKAANDDCDDATILNISASTPTIVAIDLRAASNDTEVSCENNASLEYPDVWHEFTMPVDGELQINNINFSVNSTFYDACGGNELACFNNEGSLFNVAAGTTIKLRTSVREMFAGAYTFEIIAVPNPLPTCTGTTEFISGSWDNGIPDNTINAIIRSNYNSNTDDGMGGMLGSINACSLSIDTGITVTINAGDFIDVTSNILNNGTLNVEHQASVVQQDPTAVTTNNGAINVNVTTPDLPARSFMILGSPMTAETRTDVFASAFRVRNHDATNFIPNPAVAAAFPMAENFADDNGDNWINYSGTINTAEGYLVSPQPNINASGIYNLNYSEGTLNNGEITLPIIFNTDKNSSPNIIANPYPSAILADDFINANAMVDELYFWEHLTPASADLPGYNNLNFSMEDISMYNLMGGVKASSDSSPGGDTQPNGIISTSQGFGIKANAAGTAVFTNNMRRLTGNTTLRTADEEQDKLWLSIASPEYDLKSNTLIGFTENATSQLDSGYDSNRLASVLSIFSGIDNSEVELGIQGRELFNEGITIPVGFSSQLDASTLYHISLDIIQGEHLSNVSVYLFDQQTGLKTNLSETGYEFTSEKGQFPNRFTLFFNDRSLGLTSETLSDFTIAPNPGNGIFTLKTQNQIIEKITVYDYLGRVVKNENQIDVSEVNIDISAYASGMYLVQVKTNNGALTKKYIKK